MLPGVLYADGLRGRSGFPTPAKGSLVRFRRAPRYLSVRRPPPARTGGFILPRACRLLQSSTACDLPRGPTPHGGGFAKRLPWGSSPSSRHQQAASTHARDTRSRATFRPRRFTRPRRFAPPPALRVCFAPQPRPGFALQGIVPRAEPYRVSPARSCPPGVGREKPAV
jgi:hypothetical protein